MNDCDSSPTEEQGEQEDEEEQEERLEDIFPDNFEAVDDVESDDSSANDEERKPAVSYRNSVPACDFNDNDYSLTCAFPYIFPLGQAYNRSTGTLNRDQLSHLFTQFNQVPARDRKLLAYVFDNNRRTQTLLVVSVLSKRYSKAVQKMHVVV